MADEEQEKSVSNKKAIVTGDLPLPLDWTKLNDGSDQR
ncbi:unnamed protein product, partial [marine sediment metagenome]